MSREQVETEYAHLLMDIVELLSDMHLSNTKRRGTAHGHVLITSTALPQDRFSHASRRAN